MKSPLAVVVVAGLALAGCSGADPTPPPRPSPAPTSFVPWTAPPASATPSPSLTIISTAGELKCRPATKLERQLAFDGPDVWPTFAVDLGEGWRVVSLAATNVPGAGGKPMPSSIITNGERVNFAHYPGPNAPRLKMRVLPIEFEQGYAALELAESCAVAAAKG